MLRKLAGIAILIVFLLTATPAAYYYAQPLYVASDPRKSDVIVLLSSGQLDEADWLRPDASQRVLGALKLYREGFAPVIVSSGSQHAAGMYQAELQAAWLERAGVPRDAIVVEDRSYRTYTSGVEVARLMENRGWKSAVVVTSQMDVPRVRLVFRKLGIRASYLAVPEFNAPRGFNYLSSALPVSYHATYEYAGIIFYKLKGWI